jgi:hypothetical protein
MESRIVSVLERLERETPHSDECKETRTYLGNICRCDRLGRLRLAIAQRTEAAIHKAAWVAWHNGAAHADDPRFANGGVSPHDAGVAAFESPVRDL